MDKETKLNMLRNCLADYEKMISDRDCAEIRFIRYDGRKAGIGNKEAIDKLLHFVIEELYNQINALERGED